MGLRYTTVSVLRGDKVVTQMNESCHTESCHTYGWVESNIWMSHVTHMNESCHTYEWVMPHRVMSHIWMRLSHVTHMNASQCFVGDCASKPMSRMWMSHVTHEWVMSHIWMSHVTHMNASQCFIGECASKPMSRMWMSHVTHMNESCHTYEWVMSHIWRVGPHIWMSHVTIVNGSCHTYLARNLINVQKCPQKKSGWKEMSRINESRHIKMGYVTHVRGIRSIWSHVTLNDSHLRWSHVTHRWVMSHMNELRHAHPRTMCVHLYQITKEPYSVKRALYSIKGDPYSVKRALYFIKRDPYLVKRALYSITRDPSRTSSADFDPRASVSDYKIHWKEISQNRLEKKISHSNVAHNRNRARNLTNLQ